MTPFSFIITEENAKKISMLALIELYSDKVERTEGKRIMRLYTRLMNAWNKFVEWSGGELQGGCITNIFPKIVHTVILSILVSALIHFKTIILHSFHL